MRPIPPSNGRLYPTRLWHGRYPRTFTATTVVTMHFFVGFEFLHLGAYQVESYSSKVSVRLVYPASTTLLCPAFCRRVSLSSSWPTPLRYEQLCIRIGDCTVCDGAFFGALLAILRSAKVTHPSLLPACNDPQTHGVFCVSSTPVPCFFAAFTRANTWAHVVQALSAAALSFLAAHDRRINV